MDNFEYQMCLLIQKYLKEVRNEEYTIDQIYKRERWKRVKFWHLAREHFEGIEPPNLTLEEIKSIYGK